MKNKGFTYIELLIVVVIIGLVISVVWFINHDPMPKGETVSNITTNETKNGLLRKAKVICFDGYKFYFSMHKSGYAGHTLFVYKLDADGKPVPCKGETE